MHNEYLTDEEHSLHGFTQRHSFTVRLQYLTKISLEAEDKEEQLAGQCNSKTECSEA
jgi:hypothetical protein